MKKANKSPTCSVITLNSKIGGASKMRKLNDVQQHSRRWKLQVFRVTEKEVTAADCTVTVCDFQRHGWHDNTSDIKVAHWT